MKDFSAETGQEGHAAGHSQNQGRRLPLPRAPDYLMGFHAVPPGEEPCCGIALGYTGWEKADR